MNTIKAVIKWTAIIGGALFLIYLGFILYGSYELSKIFDITYTRNDLVKNFNERQLKILELKNYFNSIVPQNKHVEIEFETDSKLFRFGVSNLDANTGSVIYPIFLEWDLNTTSRKVDSVITSIGWTQETLKTLKKHLDNANCIQIESGEPSKIGFQRSGMGMYFYNVFNNPVPDSMKSHYNDSCRYIFYNDKLVLEYGGGAIGPQCFPSEK